MQTFYDQLFSPEGEKESPEDWKLQLTQVDLEELGVIVETTCAWYPW
jgi:hypothetical protein